MSWNRKKVHNRYSGKYQPELDAAASAEPFTRDALLQKLSEAMIPVRRPPQSPPCSPVRNFPKIQPHKKQAVEPGSFEPPSSTA